MSFAEFQRSVAAESAPPVDATAALQALWHDARGDWARAHACAQDDPSLAGSWVHAYLHRKEGDPGNASYWYTRARRPKPVGTVTLAEEWAQIAQALLADM